MILDTLRLPILLATGLQHRDVDSIAHAQAGADRVAHRQGLPTAVQRGGHSAHDLAQSADHHGLAGRDVGGRPERRRGQLRVIILKMTGTQLCSSRDAAHRTVEQCR
jgi:hypothetical protein